MTAKIWVASTPTPTQDGEYDHLYIVYDPDGDPSTDNEQVFRAGPTGLPSKIQIEHWVDIQDSADALNGADPFTDRNYTVLATGTAAEDLKASISDWATDIGTPDANNIITTDIPYTLPFQLGSPDAFLPSLNSNATVASALSYGGVDIAGNMPYIQGSALNGRMPANTHAGYESYYSNSDQTISTDNATDRILFSAGGNSTYEVGVNSFGTGTIYVVEDTNTGTTDKLVLNNIDPSDVSFKRTLSGDLQIFFPWDGAGDPSIVLPDQWEGGVPRLNEVIVYPPGGGAPSVIALNDPDDFPLFRPDTVPGWVTGPRSLWDDAPDQASPLVLDLDGDGIELTQFNAATTTTFFDIDSDGFAEQTAWVGADDGLLVRDIDVNGTIDNAAELFGSSTVDGFALLQELDSNGDLIINQHDDNWGDLEVWKDANGDGYSQADELKALSFYSIESINLAGVEASTQTISGNPISHTSTFQYTNGTTAVIADAWFVHDNANTVSTADYTTNLNAAFLPSLRGFGELTDLRGAMSQDSGLLTKVQDFVGGWDYDVFADGNQLRSDIEDILFEWAGVEGLAHDARGPWVDARQLEFLEKFFGEGFIFNGTNSPDPIPRSGGFIGESWDGVVRYLNAHLFIQMSDGELYDGDVAYNAFTGELEGTFDLSQAAINDLVAYATATGVDAEAYWLEITDIIEHTKGLANVTVTEKGWLDTALSNSGLSDTWNDIVATYEAQFTHDEPITNGTSADEVITGTVANNIIHGGGGDDEIYGGLGNDTLNAGAPSTVGSELYGENGNDTLNGNTGNDTLSGGLGGDSAFGKNGDDTYVFTGGGDLYSEWAFSGSDTVTLPAGITLNDLAIYRNGTTNLFVEVGTLGSFEIDRQYVAGGSIHSYAIEQIRFSDLSTLDLLGFTSLEARGTDGGDDIRGLQIGSTHVNDTFYGYGGDDDLWGYGGNDTFYGGAGNDKLRGGAGNDTYVVGEGFDEVFESSGTDKIVIPLGYTTDDVFFLRTPDHWGTPKHLTILVQGLGQITVGSHFHTASKQIEQVEFLETGTTVNIADVSFELRGDDGNNNLAGVTTGASLDDVLNGMGGNDTLQGGNGNDTYIFSEGIDIIYETGAGTADTVSFWEGWNPQDITMYRQQSVGWGWDDLVIEDSAGNKVTVESHFDNAAATIEYVEFHDSTQWDVLNMNIAIHGTSGADSLSLSDTDNLTVYGFDGNDSLTTHTGDDTLDGGSGDDYLNGSTGNDTYIFSQGFDNATDTGGISDTLFLGAGWNPADITLYRTWVPGNGSGFDDLVIEDQNGNAMVFQQHFNNASYTLEYIDFNGVTQWDVLAITDIPLYGTSSNDTLSVAASEIIIYGLDGNDTLYGTSGSDYLAGGNGNDYLRGYAGDDAFAYSAGLDTIEDTAGTDTLLITGGTTISDITVTDHSTYDTKVTVTASTDEITLKSHRSSWVIENLSFDDGFVTDQLDSYSSWLWGTTGNDTVDGNANDNVLVGSTGNDTINSGAGADDAHGGAGTDTIYGGDGADLLHGGAGDDMLYGQDGLDTLFGGIGADTFVFESASAFNDIDVIEDFSTGESDALDLANLLNVYDPMTDLITDFVEITDSGSDSVVKVDTAGTGTFGAGTQIATLKGITGLTDEVALESSGKLIAA